MSEDKPVRHQFKYVLEISKLVCIHCGLTFEEARDKNCKKKKA